MLSKIFFDDLRVIIKHHFKEKSGHGFDHTERVYNSAVMLAQSERCYCMVDTDVIRASALLHDIARHKQDIGEVECHAAEGAKMAREILKEVGFPSEKIPKVVYAIALHRYSKGITPKTIEAKILQDADRLDALGAICIARVFSFGGKKDRPMYDPDITVESEGEYDGSVSSTSFNHFFTKILKITPESFKTEKAQEIARGRYQAIVDFTDRFKKEWNGVL